MQPDELYGSSAPWTQQPTPPPGPPPALNWPNKTWGTQTLPKSMEWAYTAPAMPESPYTYSPIQQAQQVGMMGLPVTSPWVQTRVEVDPRIREQGYAGGYWPQYSDGQPMIQLSSGNFPGPTLQHELTHAYQNHSGFNAEQQARFLPLVDKHYPALRGKIQEEWGIPAGADGVEAHAVLGPLYANLPPEMQAFYAGYSVKPPPDRRFYDARTPGNGPLVTVSEPWDSPGQSFNVKFGRLLNSASYVDLARLYGLYDARNRSVYSGGEYSDATPFEDALYALAEQYPDDIVNALPWLFTREG